MFIENQIKRSNYYNLMLPISISFIQNRAINKKQIICLSRICEINNANKNSREIKRNQTDIWMTPLPQPVLNKP